MNQPVRPAQPARSVENSTTVGDDHGNAALDRQLDAIMRPTTVEDLARKGGQLKTVKERDLRELIRQSLLQLLASETSITGAEQERILDRVQSELKKKMIAHAGEQAERLALAAENQGLQGRLAQLETELVDRASEQGRLSGLLADVQAEAAELRAEHARQALTAQPLLSDDSALRDANGALQQQLTVALGERDEARLAAEAELQHTVEIEAQLDELNAAISAYEAGIAERDELLAGRDAALAEADADLAAARAALIESEAARDERQPVLTLPDPDREAELSELRDRLDDAQRRLDDAARARTRIEQDLAAAAGGRAAAEHRMAIADAQLVTNEQRLRELQQQLGDQRKTTDLARLASVEAEALRAEVDGLKKLLGEREVVLAGERERAHADRDRHRADGAARLEAFKRVEQALMTQREQLAERDRQLAERTAELDALRAAGSSAAVVVAPVVASRTAEVEALTAAVATTRAQLAAIQAEHADLDRARRVAEADRDALRVHQANYVHVAQERDLLQRALRDAETRLAARDVILAAARPAAPAPVAADHALASAQAARLAAEAERDALRSALHTAFTGLRAALPE